MEGLLFWLSFFCCVLCVESCGRRKRKPHVRPYELWGDDDDAEFLRYYDRPDDVDLKEWEDDTWCTHLWLRRTDNKKLVREWTREDSNASFRRQYSFSSTSATSTGESELEH
jgi:hypothetical protein